jgi:hypothetical protein
MAVSFMNQAFELIHLFFAVFVVFIFFPRWLFPLTEDHPLDRGAARFLRMVFLLIVMGYVLVLLKLFELAAIVTILTLFSLRKYLSLRQKSLVEASLTSLLTKLYDFLDGLVHFPRTRIKPELRTYLTNRDQADWLYWGIGILILALCAYFRFDDALTTAAPPLSDSYVTLAWMKYIDERILFHDGIYPQGFHIILDVLHKFSADEFLYVLKYAGPLQSLGIAVSLYFVVSRLTGDRLAGMAATAVYGLFLGSYEGFPWERQVGTNSQEFGFLLVYPTLYFAVRYVQEKKKEDLWTVFAGMAAVGLVHSLAFAFLGSMIFFLLLAALWVYRKHVIIPLKWLAGAGVCSVLLSAVPIGLGLLLGKELHSSSVDYLTSHAFTFTVPAWNRLDKMAAVSLILLFVFCWKKKRSDGQRCLFLFSFFFGAFFFVLYLYGGMLTKSTLIASRAIDLWGLALSFCIGMGWHCLERIRANWLPSRWISLGLFCTLLVSGLMVDKPTAIHPYKMEWDSGVQQFLRITNMYRPKSWMIVSQEEGYSLSLGDGYHMYLSTLLQDYDPTLPPLTKKGQHHPDENLSPDVFIYHEKEIYRVSPSNSIYSLEAPIYVRRERENRELADWLKKYKESHGSLPIFYEDAHLQIIHLHREITRKEINHLLWDQ